MARYGGYTNGGYTTYKGMEKRTTDDWNRPSYAGDGYTDHHSRPMIGDAEVRKRPTISYTPESYVTKVERIVEHVHTPVVTYTSPTRVEHLSEYGVVDNNKWGRPSSPVHSRPQEVEALITTIQTEVSRPARTTFLGTTNWRNPVGTNGYGEHNGFNNNNNNYNDKTSDWNKPIGNTIRGESLADPTLGKKDGWGIDSGLKGRPNNTPLSRPTNDIGTAIEYLKEAANVTQPRFGVKTSAMPRKEPYTESIDSREAARRYGNFNFSSRPRTGESYTGTIDSREAEMKYNGTRV